MSIVPMPLILIKFHKMGHNVILCQRGHRARATGADCSNNNNDST